MFSLHETTRIRLCRAAFIAVCVLPTIGVVCYCLSLRSESYRAGCEQAIANQLGLRVQLGRVSYPRPGVALYEHVDLIDQYNRQLLARLPVVEIHSGVTPLAVKLSYPSTINGARLDRLGEALVDRLARFEGFGALDFSASNVSLRAAEGGLTFAEVEGTLTYDSQGSNLKISLRQATAGDKPASTAELAIVHRRAAQGGFNEFRFTTGETPLPCSLASSFSGAPAGLGKMSTFAGELSAAKNSAGWTATVRGRFDGIDLDGLFRDRFAHHMSGVAQVEIARATLRDGRLETAEGRLVAGPGSISKSLIHAAETHLRLSAAPAVLASRDNVLRYAQLWLGFQLDGQGLTLAGTAPRAAGAILLDPRGAVLVRQSETPRQPALNLVRALVPNRELQVAATRETDWLVHVLPLPSIASPPGAVEPVPQAKTLGIRK